VKVDITHPEELEGTFNGFDTVITTIRINRQKYKATLMDIDYQAFKMTKEYLQSIKR